MSSINEQLVKKMQEERNTQNQVNLEQLTKPELPINIHVNQTTLKIDDNMSTQILSPKPNTEAIIYD